LISAGEGGEGGGGSGGDKDGDGGGYINDEDANQGSASENDADGATCVSSGALAKRALQRAHHDNAVDEDADGTGGAGGEEDQSPQPPVSQSPHMQICFTLISFALSARSQLRRQPPNASSPPRPTPIIDSRLPIVV
jgi:hypothetical protein